MDLESPPEVVDAAGWREVSQFLYALVGYLLACVLVSPGRRPFLPGPLPSSSLSYIPKPCNGQNWPKELQSSKGKENNSNTTLKSCSLLRVQSAFHIFRNGSLIFGCGAKLASVDHLGSGARALCNDSHKALSKMVTLTVNNCMTFTRKLMTCPLTKTNRHRKWCYHRS